MSVNKRPEATGDFSQQRVLRECLAVTPCRIKEDPQELREDWGQEAEGGQVLDPWELGKSWQSQPPRQEFKALLAGETLAP